LRDIGEIYHMLLARNCQEVLFKDLKKVKNMDEIIWLSVPFTRTISPPLASQATNHFGIVSAVEQGEIG